ARPFDVRYSRELHGHTVEVWRVADVRRIGGPERAVADGHVERVPVLVAGEDLAVGFAEDVVINRRRDHLLHFFLGRPDVLEVDRVSGRGVSQWVFGKVQTDAAGQRERDGQRRRGEVIGPHFGVDAALEVAVAAKDRGDDE